MLRNKWKYVNTDATKPCNTSMGEKCTKSLREDSSVGKEPSCNS